MRLRKALVVAAATALVSNSLPFLPVLPAVVSASTTRQIAAAGTVRLAGHPPGSAAVQFPEIRGEPEGEMKDHSDKPPKPDVVNRSHSPKKAADASVPAAPVADPAAISGDPGVDLTFAGLNHRDQP